MKIGPKIPIVETEDMILREHLETDLDAFATFMASERAEYVGGPLNYEDARTTFMSMLGHWFLYGYGMWVIEHRASGLPIGRVGMILNDGWDEPELGWQLFSGYEGRGLAYQACLAARSYAAREQGLDRVISYIHPHNSRSLKLAQRLDASYERDGVLLGKTCQIWRHPSVSEA